MSIIREPLSTFNNVQKHQNCFLYSKNTCMPNYYLTTDDAQFLSEITLARKKILFWTLYRTPGQNSHPFETFIDTLQNAFEKMKAESPNCIILAGDFNFRSNIWWTGDI